MKSIAVFCASGEGFNSVYRERAYALGSLLAREKISIVFGGSKLGLMGALADGSLQSGGEVIGVLPNFMRNKEIAHDNLSRLIMVESMHERKLIMHELSDGVITLPGGFGTMEEVFEMLTWGQLGLHRKPIGFLDVNNYYHHLRSLFNHMCAEGLLRESHRDMVTFSEDDKTLLQAMKQYKPPVVDPVLNGHKT